MNVSYVTGSRILGVLLLGGLWAAGCSSSSSNPTTAATGGSSSAADTGGATSTSTEATGGNTSAATGGATSNGSTGGATSAGATGGSNAAGGNTSAGGSTGCGTTNGDHAENITFGTAASTTPYVVNSWGWGTATKPVVAQTTTGPTGLDCSTGCATLTLEFADGTAQYSGGQIVQYFGTATDSVMNLLNETITVKAAVTVTQASGATVAVPIDINLIGQDTYVSTNGVDNEWVDSLGSATTLDAALGFQTKTHKVIDAGVPSWAVTRTVCGSGLHDIAITIQNNKAIDATNGATVVLYVQSIAIAP